MTSRILDDVLLNMTLEQSIHLKKDTDLRKAGHRFGTSMTSVDTDLRQVTDLSLTRIYTVVRFSSFL